MALRALIDTDVLLDYLLVRKPYEQSAQKIVQACENGQVSGCIAAHSFSNMFYILRKIYTIKERKTLLYDFCQLFDVESIDRNKILAALKNEKFSDFEDCLQMECADAYQADYIITRNVKDFKYSRISCIDPSSFCNLLNQLN